MTKHTSSTTTTGMETAQPEPTSIIHSSQYMFLQVIPSQSTFHHPSKVASSAATRSPQLGSSSNSKHPTTTRRMETSVSSKETTAQPQSDPLMARTGQVDLPLRYTLQGLLIRPEQMENMSLPVLWAIGWEGRTRLLLRLNRASKAKCMSLEGLVFLILLLQTTGLPWTSTSTDNYLLDDHRMLKRKSCKSLSAFDSGQTIFTTGDGI